MLLFQGGRELPLLLLEVLGTPVPQGTAGVTELQGEDVAAIPQGEAGAKVLQGEDDQVAPQGMAGATVL